MLRAGSSSCAGRNAAHSAMRRGWVVLITTSVGTSVLLSMARRCALDPQQASQLLGDALFDLDPPGAQHGAKLVDR
jgi:hypothetical protein